jgi:hypothetical protein
MVQPSSNENGHTESFTVVKAGLRSAVGRGAGRDGSREAVRDVGIGGVSGTTTTTGRESTDATPRATPSGGMLIVKDLLGGLDNATIAGQHYICEKILTVFRSELSTNEARLSDLQRRTATLSLEKLSHEAKRMVLDLGSFVSRAEALVDSLSLS